MICNKCSKKKNAVGNIETADIVERKCKACKKKKFKSKFLNVCYDCQRSGYCVVCGDKIVKIQEDSNGQKT